ncbi:hypothetical protein [Nocardiopsis lucentensis]|uniref:hypothetical protein n=1 Tax=Nocardiopsis lucentensis TaxID=53441 RepID=UPI001268D0EA|nr:hypothetical protein [Nocardiopsis lucentensis]
MTPREAAKALCLELDKHDLKPLPRKGMVIEVHKGDQSQTVLLRETGEDLYWYWVWDSYRTGTEPYEYDRALPVGQEPEFARRIFGVLSIPKVDL